MADQKPQSFWRLAPSSPALPLFLLFGVSFMGADFTATELGKLRALGIPYPSVMDYFHFIAAGSGVALWLATFWKWPRLAPGLVLILSFAATLYGPRLYVERRVASIPVNRRLEADELKPMERHSHIHMFDSSSPEGDAILVARWNEEQARRELNQLGVLRNK